jgi:uncharacterized protein (DUF58 family)
MSPDARRLREALLHRRKRGPRGEGAPRPRRSDGYEFAELRAYVPGDDVRRIDWAATARAGGLQTRVLFEDHSLVLAAAVDASGSMHVGRQRRLYDLACEAADAWYAMAQADDRCGRFGDERSVFATRRGPASAHLCAIETAVDARTSLEAALHAALVSLPWDAALLIVSDFYDLDALEPVLRLCSVRFDVTALFARDPWIDGLPLRGFVTLRDAESGAPARLFVSKAGARRFAEAAARREADVLSRLSGLRIRTAALDERGAAVALRDAFGLAS